MLSTKQLKNYTNWVKIMEQIERLSGDYNRGFTAGIKAVIDVFEYTKSDINYHGKRMNAKIAHDLLQCCLENRERLRESVNGFIRWNTRLNGFEFYEPAERSNNA